MFEYNFRLLPVLLATLSLTPASATTYTPGLDRAAIGVAAGATQDAAQAQTWGATYDNLTGKFAIGSATGDRPAGDCGAAGCDAAADLPAAPVQAAARQDGAPVAKSPPARAADVTPPAAGSAPSATAVSAASNWDVNALISDAYAYNGNNNAFLINSASSYLPAIPDFNSWALMFGGMIAVFFLMRRVAPPSVSEPDAVELAWGGPEMRALELRAPSAALRAKAATAIPALCCSRQALPGS